MNDPLVIIVSPSREPQIWYERFPLPLKRYRQQDIHPVSGIWRIRTDSNHQGPGRREPRRPLHQRQERCYCIFSAERARAAEGVTRRDKLTYSKYGTFQFL